MIECKPTRAYMHKRSVAHSCAHMLIPNQTCTRICLSTDINTNTDPDADTDTDTDTDTDIDTETETETDTDTETHTRGKVLTPHSGNRTLTPQHVHDFPRLGMSA